MAINRIQFQPGLSLLAFLRRYAGVLHPVGVDLLDHSGSMIFVTDSRLARLHSIKPVSKISTKQLAEATQVLGVCCRHLPL